MRTGTTEEEIVVEKTLQAVEEVKALQVIGNGRGHGWAEIRLVQITAEKTGRSLNLDRDDDGDHLVSHGLKYDNKSNSGDFPMASSDFEAKDGCKLL